MPLLEYHNLLLATNEDLKLASAPFFIYFYGAAGIALLYWWLRGLVVILVGAVLAFEADRLSRTLMDDQWRHAHLAPTPLVLWAWFALCILATATPSGWGWLAGMKAVVLILTPGLVALQRSWTCYRCAQGYP